MRILHLSDTHSYHTRLRNLPEADIVVHSGDFCMAGSEQKALDFLNWFCDLPYRHKIFICGNHDECLYGNDINGLDSNVHYMCNSGIEIEGVKFYGVPMFFVDCLTDQQKLNYERIPPDTDVLITHAPAHGILDRDGSIHLARKIFLKSCRPSTLRLIFSATYTHSTVWKSDSRRQARKQSSQTVQS